MRLRGNAAGGRIVATQVQWWYPLPATEAAIAQFAGVVTDFGGLGSMPGALLGGVLIGLSEAMSGLFFAPSAKSMFAIALLILVLLFRPQGLLGRRI